MKDLMKLAAMIFFCICSTAYAGTGNLTVSGTLGVGTTDPPSASAVLEANSTTKGLLPPRMDTSQRDNISSPATGLLIYNTTENAYNYYSGTTWVMLPNYPTAAGNGAAGTIPVRSAGQGFLNVIYETTLATDQPSVTITGLNGDADIWWELIAAIKTTVTDTSVRIRYNEDAANTNYRNNFYSVNANDDQPNLLVGSNTQYGLAKQLIYANSGSYRSNFGQAITPTATNGNRVNSGYWKNSTDNIISITIIPDSGNIAAGSRIILRRPL